MDNPENNSVEYTLYGDNAPGRLSKQHVTLDILRRQWVDGEQGWESDFS